MLIFYDYEVFKYDWLVVFYDAINDKKTVIVNNKESLEKFHKVHQDHIYVGFNSRGYDQYIHKGILCGFDPYDISQWIITKKRKGWEYSDLFRKIKMYNYDVFKGKTDVGLKTLEAFMGNNIEETSVPFDIDRKLTITEIQETIKYCTHDVMQLVEVFNRRIDDFKTHLAMINEFELGLNHISKTTAQLIAVILGSVKTEYNDEWDIYLPDTLRLNKYWHIGEWFKNNRSLDPYITTVAGVKHVFADGGLHGAIPKFSYICKPDEIMIMADVASMYPSIMLAYDLLSRSIQDKARFKYIYDMNIELKKLKDPRRPIYKLICNTTYGCSGDQYNNMYDPRNRRLVCIFGQLFLLDLIEKLENVSSFKLLQSNTDGVLFVIKRKDFDLVDDIVFEWETRTRLNMEFEYYEKLYQKDVNNYVAVKYSGKNKSKGGYVKELSELDNDLPIVNTALINYMTNNISMEETIYGCNELLQFQKVFKLTDKYEYVRHNNTDLYNKSYRVFASTDDKDTPIYKCKEDKCDKFANTPEHAFIENGYINGVPIPRNLDKKWYVDMAYKRLEQFTGGGNNYAN